MAGRKRFYLEKACLIKGNALLPEKLIFQRRMRFLRKGLRMKYLSEKKGLQGKSFRYEFLDTICECSFL